MDFDIFDRIFESDKLPKSKTDNICEQLRKYMYNRVLRSN